MAVDPLIELRDVNKYYGELHVLQDINLTVGKGEVVVVIGPSGSGKSTLCRAINRLETIHSGEIQLDGQPLPEEGKALAKLRAEVGSSNSRALGSMARARAMATRCCWPPESCAGYLSAWEARPTRSRS